MERFNFDDITFLERIYNRPNICEVYKARLRTHPNEFVCVKKVIIKSSKDTTDKIREVIAMATASHPNVIKLYTMGIIAPEERKEKELYICMEYLSEGDLKKLIKGRKEKNAFWTQDELLNYAQQLIEIFAFLQTKDISHRDIKPQNILVDNQGTLLKISDLGAATKVRDGELTIQGTPAYISPSIRIALSNFSKTGKFKVNHDPYKSDVFSLGLVLLYMASLKEVNDLNNLETLKNSVNNRINELPCSLWKIKSLIWYMLQEKEDYRPDFIVLKNTLDNLLNETTLLCPNCQETKLWVNFYKIGNEIMCRNCVENFQVSKQNRIYCLICKSYLNGAICSCLGDKKRCLVCKDFEHKSEPCLSQLKKSVEEKNYSIVIVCDCEMGNFLNEDWKFKCAKCGEYCLVCGNKFESNEHNLCEFMLKYYIEIQGLA